MEMETFLSDLEMEEHLCMFKENGIELELLMDMSTSELHDILNNIGFNVGNRWKIIKQIQKLRTEKEIPSKLQATGGKDDSYAEQARNAKDDQLLAKDNRKANMKAIIGTLEKTLVLSIPSKEYCKGPRKDIPPVPPKPHCKGPIKDIPPVPPKPHCKGPIKDIPSVQRNSHIQEPKEGIFSEKDWQEVEIRMVLLGKTGTGKSATGNTILGCKAFTSLMSGASVTSKCKQRSARRFERKIVVVDTPGIFDTNVDNLTTQTEIFKCIAISSPGPHAFILVLSLTRYTEEEKQAVKHFANFFGEDIYKYLIILFTRKDDLDYEQKSLCDHIKTVPHDLQMFIKECGGRIIAFNNKLKGDEQDGQVVELLSMILDNIKANNGDYYTNEMYKKAEAEMKKREKELIEKANEERKKEIEGIEKKVSEKYETQLAEGDIKNKKIQNQLQEILKKTEKGDIENKELLDKMKSYEKQLENSKGNVEIIQVKHELEKIRMEMSFKNEIAMRDQREKEILEKSLASERKLREELQTKQHFEMITMKKDVEKKFESQKAEVRDVVRKEVEENEGLLSRGWNWLKSCFTGKKKP